MTIQVSPIQSPETSLLQDPSIQSASDKPFQTYLEDEQQRLALFFNPLAQFSFGSMFSYPDFNFQIESAANNIKLFADTETASQYDSASQINNSGTPVALAQNQFQPANQTGQEINQYYNIQSPQSILQNLLLKTGWLTPNLEAQPLFQQAQTEGILLGKHNLQILVDQILSQVKIVKEKGKVELTLGLKPENLGELLLTLTSKSGLISIQIEAPEKTKKLIDAELAELELALKKANINLAEIKIVGLKEEQKNV